MGRGGTRGKVCGPEARPPQEVSKISFLVVRPTACRRELMASRGGVAPFGMGELGCIQPSLFLRGTLRASGV